MNRERFVTVASVVLAGLLFLVSLVAVVAAVQQGTTADVVTGLLSVYLTGLLLAGILRDELAARWWQVAFFAGVVVWGGFEYVTGGGLVAILLLVVGVVMAVAALRSE